MPKRFADRWGWNCMSQTSDERITRKLEKLIHAWSVAPAGTEGYEKAEVTAAALDTDELSSKTM